MTKTLLRALVLLVVAPFCALADLGAGIRRAQAPKISFPVNAPSSPWVVQLERLDARAVGNGRGSFYVGSVRVGQPPQELRVLFDTSSGNVLLPHRACSDPACVEHRRFSPWESATAMDVNITGELVQQGQRLAHGAGRRQGVIIGFTQSDLGQGEAQAVFVRDHVCMGSKAGGDSCVDMALTVATKLQDVPFRAMPNDGIVGLGLGGLATGPLCSFLGRLHEGSEAMLPQFGITLGAESGEIHFGGHDATRFAAPLHWFPVDHPESGYWQVAILAVRVGNVTIDSCQRGCHGIVDTGASRLGVQASHLPKLRAALASSMANSGSCQGPELALDLGGFMLTLQPEDYTDAQCAPQLGPLDLEEPEFAGVYALGETVLRRYYAAFDWGAQRIGFAPAAGQFAGSIEKLVV